MREVNHRSKNLLAVVEAIIRQTAARTRQRDFLRRLSERLQSLSISQDLLTASEWRGVDLRDLVTRQLHNLDLGGPDRVAVEGDAMTVTPGRLAGAQHGRPRASLQCPQPWRSVDRVRPCRRQLEDRGCKRQPTALRHALAGTRWPAGPRAASEGLRHHHPAARPRRPPSTPTSASTSPATASIGSSGRRSVRPWSPGQAPRRCRTAADHLWPLRDRAGSATVRRPTKDPPPTLPMTAETSSADPRFAAFRHGAFLRYWSARFLATFSTQIVSVAVGWQIYDLTRDPFDLGLVGLIQFAAVAAAGAGHRRRRRPLRPPPDHGPRPRCSKRSARWCCCVLSLRGPHRAGRDLRRAGRLRHRARLLRAGLRLAGRQPGAAGGFRQCGRLELVGLADGDHRRPGRRRPALRYRRRGRLWHRRGADGRAPGCSSSPSPSPRSAPPTEKAVAATLFAGFRYIWEREGRARRHLARPLRRAARRRRGAAAGLCARHPGTRPVGPRPAARRARHRRHPRRRLACRPSRSATMPAASCSSSSALFGVFTVVFGVSTLAWLSIAGARPDRRRRHGQRLCPRDADPAVDAGPRCAAASTPSTWSSSAPPTSSASSAPA